MPTSSDDIPTFHIDLDKKCAECGGSGTAPSGICIRCTTRALKREPMKSREGKAVQARFLENVAATKARLNAGLKR